MPTRTPLTSHTTLHAPTRGRRLSTRHARRVVCGLIVGASTFLVSGTARAHEEAPPPYPEPVDSTPRMNAEVMQESPTFLYLGIGVVALGILVSLFVIIGRRNAQRTSGQ